MEAAQVIETFAGGDELFVIGGSQIYQQALSQVERIYLTRVHDSFEGDCELPADWLDGFELRDEEPQECYSFLTYERR
jgi:dihydrofolate reductase